MTDVTGDPAPIPTPDDGRREAIDALEGSFSELVTVFRRLIAEAAETASPGMLPGTFKVLSAINRMGPVTLSALAERLTADKGLTSRSVSELEELGLVERTPDPLDRRSRLIAVTPLGTERLTAARAPHSGRLATALADWSVEDIRHAAVLLSALATGRAPADDAR
ncbi:MarR family transcriptional regulator [Microbacterium sp. dk485]|uniref:MarR family transcriptional regulator n=1 Tax=Microbacterium wangchenii TaxID=2541726 RepID=A0ABX5SWU8_9MICO|nr:MarR family winged helix-turn-helix transcriptional regulator [Microbacterium sp. EYE_512]QBR89706.1 MarR family transcriptional regulator [Microbacterium wangchenii]TFV81055.1 MarR family transcriptional regulator [Microbacterium sp. dk485]TXK16696.1 winged helix-turn-helix transcriptional regulator [Microbacterium wangchenii]